MSAFRFRLERLLEVRRAKEDVAQRDFARASGAAREETRRLAALLAEREDGGRDPRRGPLDLAALRQREDHLGAVDRRVRACRDRLAEFARAEDEKRRALVEAMKAVKVLERFRERKLAEWARSEDRKEREVLDEAARAGREGA